MFLHFCLFGEGSVEGGNRKVEFYRFLFLFYIDLHRASRRHPQFFFPPLSLRSASNNNIKKIERNLMTYDVSMYILEQTTVVSITVPVSLLARARSRSPLHDQCKKQIRKNVVIMTCLCAAWFSKMSDLHHAPISGCSRLSRRSIIRFFFTFICF